jgi:hypothetical protein
MEFLVVLAILLVVVLVVSAPLRRAARPGPGRRTEVAELEAAREAKYREIRDADLDRRTGKLSEADYEAVDRTLRAEALEILDRLDRARGEDHASTNGSTV